MARRVNRKCQLCATLTTEAAIAQHGTDTDNCWNPRDERNLGYDCHRRRNHYRYRQEVNAERQLARHQAKQKLPPLNDSINPLETALSLTLPPVPGSFAAVLVLYRQKPDSPVHAVATEVWQGNQKLAGIAAVHCLGLRGDQLSEYIRELLQLLNQQFGISRFEDVVKELPVHQCPVMPCPYREGA